MTDSSGVSAVSFPIDLAILAVCIIGISWFLCSGSLGGGESIRPFRLRARGNCHRDTARFAHQFAKGVMRAVEAIAPGGADEPTFMRKGIGPYWRPASFCALQDAQPGASASASYLGFDRNDYPGEAALSNLRKTFRYTSYWLNPPPGETANGWVGKRAILRENGFGFLVLFNGHTDAEIKAAALHGRSAAALGAAEGKAAVAAAAREGFPADVVIFLDQEEGGRLLPEQDAYIFAWIDAVRRSGRSGRRLLFWDRCAGGQRHGQHGPGYCRAGERESAVLFKG